MAFKCQGQIQSMCLGSIVTNESLPHYEDNPWNKVIANSKIQAHYTCTVIWTAHGIYNALLRRGHNTELNGSTWSCK